MRVEAKYHLRAEAAFHLRQELVTSGYVFDEHCAEGAPYAVHSIYLDSPTYEAYHEKLEGQTRRTKYRLRFYDETSLPSTGMNLERKEKDGQLSWKVVERIDYAAVQQFVTAGGGPLLDRLDPAAGYLEPVIGVEYQRVALLHPVHGARLTLDTELRWRGIDAARESFLGEACFEPLASDEVILELKVPRSHAREITALVRRWDLSWSAISKYALCVGHMERCWLS